MRNFPLTVIYIRAEREEWASERASEREREHQSKKDERVPPAHAPVFCRPRSQQVIQEPTSPKTTICVPYRRIRGGGSYPKKGTPPPPRIPRHGTQIVVLGELQIKAAEIATGVQKLALAGIKIILIELRSCELCQKTHTCRN